MWLFEVRTKTEVIKDWKREGDGRDEIGETKSTSNMAELTLDITALTINIYQLDMVESKAKQNLPLQQCFGTVHSTQLLVAALSLETVFYG